MFLVDRSHIFKISVHSSQKGQCRPITVNRMSRIWMKTNTHWESYGHNEADTRQYNRLFFQFLKNILYLLFFVVVVIFHFYIQYRHYNSFTQQDITHTILAFSDLDIYMYVLN
jgi:zona occludens toxin (predicted ATPase)